MANTDLARPSLATSRCVLGNHRLDRARLSRADALLSVLFGEMAAMDDSNFLDPSRSFKYFKAR